MVSKSIQGIESNVFKKVKNIASVKKPTKAMITMDLYLMKKFKIGSISLFLRIVVSNIKNKMIIIKIGAIEIKA